ncbi:lipase family protein [Streptomyces sp. NPDC051840]|uniref:lipase family protein n=1 Tax=Streptomyces sp. NPDC051840 TaxID=3154752 RepID=UPI003418F897
MTHVARFGQRTAVTAALVATVVAGAVLVAPQAADARTPQSPTHGAPRHGEPAGALLDRTELPAAFRTPATGRAYRVHYRSTDEHGAPDTVSGMVYLPKGKAPRGGWPVVAWDHGTVGISDACAPSVTGPDARAHTLFESWLSRGYAVAATDFEGLGTKGDHAYLAGRSAAHATADIVRAARHLDRGVGRRWALYGFSQGAGAALFTAAYGPRYAPELDFRGTAAAAPPTHWDQIIDMAGVNDPAAPANPYVALIVSGMATADRNITPDEYLTPRGMDVLDVARGGGCFADIFKAGEGLKNSDFRYDTPLNGAPAIADLLKRYAEPPLTHYRDPLLIVQGTADTTVPEVTSRQAVAALKAVGTRVTYSTYPGVEHSPLPVTAMDTVNAWLDRRLAR